MEPQNQQTEPQGPTKYENHAKMEAPSVTMGSQGRPKCKKSAKKFPKVVTRHENVPQGAENTHMDTNNQATNEGNKGRHESANKQTNGQTLPYTFTQTKKPLTIRPLDH